MEFIDLKRQQKIIKLDLDTRIQEVLKHGKYIMGPEVYELEKNLESYVGVRNCIAVSSGTDALLISMMALGIGPGDEVITSPFTFVANVEMIALLGAKPVFVDIEYETYNINTTLIEKAITEKTKLILSVSLFGQCPNMTKINELAKKYKLPVIEDGAQSFGATQNNKKSCGLSTIGCTSFFPSKTLGCYGDGGAIFTDDLNIAELLRKIRSHGQNQRYSHQLIGINGRLDTIQAAILLSKLSIFPQEVFSRNNIGNYYNELFSKTSLKIKTPVIQKNNTHVFSQYSILVENRDKLIVNLNKAGIPTAVHYPIPLHKQRAFLTSEFNLEVSEEVSSKILSLPMHPYLEQSDQEMIVDTCLSLVN
jgi:UDP-2-acetamido-2-deoxy-ribo-hexuluronate aminotransferase